MYMQKKKIRIVEVMNFKRIYKNFSHVIGKQAFILVEMYDHLSMQLYQQQIIKFNSLLSSKNFTTIYAWKRRERKRHQHLIQRLQLTKTTEKRNKSNENNRSNFDRDISFRDDDQLILIYICDQKHWFAACS